MKYLLKISLIIFISLVCSACSSKHITIKSLKTPNYTNISIKNIFIDEFINDNINQKMYIENKLINHNIENKFLYNIKTNHKNIDTIIDGEILNKSLVISKYNKIEKNYNRCKEYNKDGKCLEYSNKKIYCEKRAYNVETKIQIKNNKELTLFSNIYSKNLYTNFCQDDPDVDDEFSIYKSLANDISNTFLKDISFYYSYENILFIEELEDESLYSDSIIKAYNSIIENIDKNLNISKLNLEKLDTKLNNKSYEILYNLGLIYEYENNLNKALEYYKMSNEFCFNQENSILINSAITRIENNLKIKTNL